MPITPLPPRQAPDPIQNAMSAAPLSLAQNATILGWPTEAGGEMIVLREGTNGWTCVPDDPNTPGNDPVCLDAAWMSWFAAYMAGADPQTATVGISYMLQGGSTASNTDPFATAPAAGEDWVTDPAHLMIIVPGKLDQTVFSTDPASGGPYIMWAGTPYEHLMIPVQEGQ
jgi:hypothetical protein